MHAIQIPELFRHPVLYVRQSRVVVLHDTDIAREDGDTARIFVVESLPVQSFTEFRFDGFAFAIQAIEQRLIEFLVRLQVKLNASLGVPIERELCRTVPKGGRDKSTIKNDAYSFEVGGGLNRLSSINTTPIFLDTTKARSNLLKKSIPSRMSSDEVDKRTTPISVLPKRVVFARAVSMATREPSASVTDCVPSRGRQRDIARHMGN